MIQLLGRLPGAALLERGARTRELIDANGALIGLGDIAPYPERGFVADLEKAGLMRDDVRELNAFMLATLDYDAAKRPSARALLRHPWAASSNFCPALDDKASGASEVNMLEF